MDTVRLILMVIAIVCFGVAAFMHQNTTRVRVGLIPLGLLCWALAEVLGGVGDAPKLDT